MVINVRRLQTIMLSDWTTTRTAMWGTIALWHCHLFTKDWFALHPCCLSGLCPHSKQEDLLRPFFNLWHPLGSLSWKLIEWTFPGSQPTKRNFLVSCNMTGLSTKPLFTLESKSSWKASRTALANHSVSTTHTNRVTAGFQAWVPWTFHLIQPSDPSGPSVFMTWLLRVPSMMPCYLPAEIFLQVVLASAQPHTHIFILCATLSWAKLLLAQTQVPWSDVQTCHPPLLWPALWCLHACCCM